MTIDPAPPSNVDFLVVGAGIAGASAGYFLAPHGRVLILERESQPGYHSTGRSAALFAAAYGNPQVRAMTRASRAFLSNPPPGFAEHPLMTPRGALFVAAPGQEAALEREWRALSREGAGTGALAPCRLDAARMLALIPALRADRVIGGILDPDASDLDVHALHHGFLSGMRRAGGTLVCDAGVTSLRHESGMWRAVAAGREYHAPVVLNAAGAWADRIAALAGVRGVGLQPKRRSAFVFAPPTGVAVAAWPLAIGIDEDWYFKPDAGALLGSPANADPVEPHDVAPEEIDIATGIFRIEDMTSLSIRRPTRIWAGLRSFVADGGLVAGFAPDAPGFFWVAAQGGYGIQTAPAMGETVAALVRGRPIPAHVAAEGITPDLLGPQRLGNRPG
jgi:D-arginine dehydrogenase